MESRVDAARHGVPDGIEPTGDVLVVAERLLVDAGELGDRQPVLIAQREQFLGRAVVQWEARRPHARRLAFAPDESAADRVVGLAQHESGVVGGVLDGGRGGTCAERVRGAGLADGGGRGIRSDPSRASAVCRRPGFEGHGVRVPGQPGARLEDDVVLRERDCVRAGERQLRTLAPRGPRRADGVRVDGLGLEAHEPGDDGVGRAMADAGGAERAVERAGDAGDGVEEALLAQTDDEVEGGPHGTDRVGARGSYTDGEQLERRDVGAHSSRLRGRVDRMPAVITSR